MYATEQTVDNRARIVIELTDREKSDLAESSKSL